MSKILLKEGYTLIYTKNGHKINIEGLEYNDTLILKGWMEIIDFIAVLESALRNRLGTQTSYKIGKNISISGVYEKKFLINIDINFLEKSIVYDLVETQQLVSKLNKLLHSADKLYSLEASLYL